MNPNHFAVMIALVSFALSSAFYLHAFSHELYKEKLTKCGYGLFIIATFLVTFVAINAKVQGIYSITSGFLLVSLLAWMTLIAQMFFRIRTAGTFVAPFLTLITVIHLLTASPHKGAPVDKPETLIQIHIYCSVIGEAFAILAVAIAILYILQQRAMKKKQLTRLLGANLSLHSLEKALIICIWSGFFFLTSGLILGAIYTQFYSGMANVTLTSKIIWALLVWTWYLITLISKNVFKISGKKMANMTFVGFGIMAIGFFGLLGK